MRNTEAFFGTDELPAIRIIGARLEAALGIHVIFAWGAVTYPNSTPPCLECLTFRATMSFRGSAALTLRMKSLNEE